MPVIASQMTLRHIDSGGRMLHAFTKDTWR
jgi:hypothetical protein